MIAPPEPPVAAEVFTPEIFFAIREDQRSGAWSSILQRHFTISDYQMKALGNGRTEAGVLD
jgi:hypothetical protein